MAISHASEWVPMRELLGPFEMGSAFEASSVIKDNQAGYSVRSPYLKTLIRETNFLFFGQTDRSITKQLKFGHNY